MSRIEEMVARIDVDAEMRKIDAGIVRHLDALGRIGNRRFSVSRWYHKLGVRYYRGLRQRIWAAIHDDEECRSWD